MTPESGAEDLAQPNAVPERDRFKSDQRYIDWLNADLGGLIDELKLSDLRKRMLKSRWLDQVLWMEGRADRARNWYYWLRLAAIIGGILIPICITISQVSRLGWMVWVATLWIFRLLGLDERQSVPMPAPPSPAPEPRGPARS